MTDLNITDEDVRVEQVSKFIYLNSLITRNRVHGDDIERRAKARKKVKSAMHFFNTTKRQKGRVYLLIPILMYGSESCV